MPCTDRRIHAAWVGLGLLVSCSSAPPPATAPSHAPRTAPSSTAAAAAAAPSATTRLGAPGQSRNWNELRMHAARRLVAANPHGTYTGTVPDILLAIPVLEIELNGDGSVRRVDVLRKPRQALDTVQLAVDAVHRAAPYGDVSRLPKPWKFTESFLFNDDRKFKPRTLEL